MAGSDYVKHLATQGRISARDVRVTASNEADDAQMSSTWRNMWNDLAPTLVIEARVAQKIYPATRRRPRGLRRRASRCRAAA